jgi:hypothetical protein
MAKKEDNDRWWIAGLILVGGAALYYLQTGLGKQNDSTFLPNTLEMRIDSLISALNDRFGKRWIDLGVAFLKYNLQHALPAAVVTLIDVVAKVETTSKSRLMTSCEKRQLAVQMVHNM